MDGMLVEMLNAVGCVVIEVDASERRGRSFCVMSKTSVVSELFVVDENVLST